MKEKEINFNLNFNQNCKGIFDKLILINLINEDRQENRVNCLTVTIGKGGGAEWMETRFRHSFEQKILKK